MKSVRTTVLFCLSALALITLLSMGCAQTTEKKIEQRTDTAIADTADAMNKVAAEVRTVSTNVATHVVDFSTNAWAKTKQGAKKVVVVTTNVVNDVGHAVK